MDYSRLFKVKVTKFAILFDIEYVLSGKASSIWDKNNLYKYQRASGKFT